jgi:eukaryotic-like serine/threonine-protein kinase
VVGEISLLTGEARTADVAACSPVRALALSVADFNAVANVHPHVRLLLTNVVADRLGKAAYDSLGGKDLHGYRIVRCVGRGGMGVVYEATRIGTVEIVAVKMLNHSLLYQQGAVDRFTREAETLKSLRHRSIARVYETFFAYGTHFLVVGYCEGSTLKDSIARSGCLDEGMTRKIVGELADALRYLHRQGLVHRDLSPSNVMLTHGAGVKLLDFGLVKDDPTWRDGEAGTRTVSVATVVQGTPAYMAPEQFGRTPVDYRVDVYALACVAYEALTGQPVSRATDLLGMVQEKLRFVLPPPSAIGQGISAEMHGFLLRGLDPQPEKRTVDLDTLAAWADAR